MTKNSGKQPKSYLEQFRERNKGKVALNKGSSSLSRLAANKSPQRNGSSKKQPQNEARKALYRHASPLIQINSVLSQKVRQEAQQKQSRLAKKEKPSHINSVNTDYSSTIKMVDRKSIQKGLA